MLRRFVTIVIACIAIPTFVGSTARAATGTCPPGTTPLATPETPSLRWKGTWTGCNWPAGSSGGHSWPSRDFYIYVPPTLQPAGDRSLIVNLHGTTQKAIDYAKASKVNDLADEYGFIVVWPEEATGGALGIDNSGANASRAWPWSRASFENRDDGEWRLLADLATKLTGEYAVDPGRVYIAGLSAGAIMATAEAILHPEVFAAEASWAGCSFLCSDANGDIAHAKAPPDFRGYVPIIEFAGSTDYLVNPVLSEMAITGWTGANDYFDDGKLNQSVSRTATEGPTNHGSFTPVAPNTGPADGSRGDLGTCLYVSRPKGNNPCPGGTLGWSSYPYRVTKFGLKARPSSVVVESWFIHGMSHNYAGGSTEGSFSDPLGPDTSLAAWTFLDTHARTAPRASVSDVSIKEGDSGQTTALFTVSLASAHWLPVDVTVSTRDGTAQAPADYFANSEILTFAPGELSKSFAVQINGNRRVDGSRSFNVELTNARTRKAVGVGTIEDDDVAPVTSITEGPAEGSTIGTSSPRLSFISSKANSTFQCRFDSVSFATCSSPYVEPLADGTHQFDVRAVDEDGNAGHVASRTFTVDTTAPETTITSSQLSRTNGVMTAVFDFVSSERGSSFMCRIDSQPFASCTSPKTYEGLKGKHLFEVYAIDVAGNADSTTASQPFPD